MATRPRTVRVPDDLWDALLDASAVRGVTVTDVILAAVRAYLARAPESIGGQGTGLPA